MVLKSLTTSIILTCFVHISFAQDGYFEFGARSAGMANSTVATSDVFSVFNNIGALHGVEDFTVFAGYRHRFGLTELNSIAAGVIKPFSFGTAGFSFYRFGGDLLNQQKASLGFSNKFGLVSLGANISYLQYKIESLGNSSSLVIEFGGTAEITNFLKFGAHVFNLNQAKLGNEDADEIPLVMKAGLSFTPNEELMINVETVKSLENEAQFRAGVEYLIIPKIAIRSGIETNPVKGSFGLGFIAKRFVVDYAYNNHSILNDIHDFTIALKL